MKVNKTQGVLFIFNKLTSDGYITKDIAVQELEINDLTFYRYIQEIRAYLYNFGNIYDLEFNKTDKRYYLRKSEF